MKIAVWDTYVTKKDGTIMHFDILVPEEIKDSNVIYSFGRKYLEMKSQAGQEISSKECIFCHTEIARPHWEEVIRKNGYFIVEMENCN